MRDIGFSEHCHRLAVGEEERRRVEHLNQLHAAATAIGNALTTTQLRAALGKMRWLLAQAPPVEIGLGLFIFDDIQDSMQTKSSLEFHLRTLQRHLLEGSPGDSLIRATAAAILDVLDAEICRVECGYQPFSGEL